MNQDRFRNYFKGNCSADESREVEQWITQNLESEEFYRLSSDMLEEMNLCDPAETKRAYRKLRRRIASTHDNSRSLQWGNISRRVAGLVATLAVGAFTAYFLFLHSASNQSLEPTPVDVVQYYAGRGVNNKVQLPDSTIVTLFGDSRIIYDRNGFDSRRQVWLFGDAFFDVARRNGSGFDVKCINTDIHVTGTSFEVLSHDADDNFEVSLYSGSVRVTPRYNGHNDTLRLHPGDVVRIDKLSGTITRHTVPWLETDSLNVVYVGSKISDILSRLERRFDKTIILQDESNIIGDTRLNMIFHPTDSLETVLSAICEYTNLKMKHQSGNIVLHQEP